jgi:WD40 repeat protein
MNTKKIISGVLMVVIAFSFLAAVPAANAQVTELWGERYNGGHDDLPWSVAVDSEDNVIVTGWSDDGTANGYNYYTVKYDKNGIEQWSKTYDFCGDHDMAFDVAVDSEDNVIVTGASLKWTYDYYTIKYDKNDGHEIWSQRYDGGHPWPTVEQDIRRRIRRPAL